MSLPLSPFWMHRDLRELKMENIWAKVKQGATVVGQAAGNASRNAKLRTEIALIDRELRNRQAAFGVQLYDYVAPLAQHPSFYSSDDTLTTTLQPPFIMAQREVAALEIKLRKCKEELNLKGAQRAATCTPAQDWQTKLANAGKSTALGAGEAKISTEISMIQGRIQRHKQEFGSKLYADLERLEDTQQWLPTDREIRTFYDTCRRDVDKIKLRRASKQKELEALGGGRPSSSNENDTPEPVKEDRPPWGATNQASNDKNSSTTSSSSWTTTSAPQQPPPNYPPPQPPSSSSSHYSASSGYVAPPPTAPQQQQQPRDPYDEDSFFNVVPMQTPLQQMSDPFASAPPPTMGTPGFEPFNASSQPKTQFSHQSQSNGHHDPFAGL